MSAQPNTRTAKAGIAVAALLAAAAMGATASGIGAYWTTDTDAAGTGGVEVIAGRSVALEANGNWQTMFRKVAPGWTLQAFVPDEADRTVTVVNRSTETVTIDLTSTALGLDDGGVWRKPGQNGFGHLFRYGFWATAAIDAPGTDKDVTHTYGDPVFPGTFADLTAADGTQTTSDIQIPPGEQVTMVIDSGFHNWSDEDKPDGAPDGAQDATKYDGALLQFSLLQKD